MRHWIGTTDLRQVREETESLPPPWKWPLSYTPKWMDSFNANSEFRSTKGHRVLDCQPLGTASKIKWKKSTRQRWDRTHSISDQFWHDSWTFRQRRKPETPLGHGFDNKSNQRPLCTLNEFFLFQVHCVALKNACRRRPKVTITLTEQSCCSPWWCGLVRVGPQSSPILAREIQTFLRPIQSNPSPN